MLLLFEIQNIVRGKGGEKNYGPKNKYRAYYKNSITYSLVIDVTCNMFMNIIYLLYDCDVN